MTPEEQAAAMIADPEWQWATIPNAAMGHAAQQAAQAVTGTGIYRGHRDGRTRAIHWTRVGLVLAAEAGADPGAVLKALAERYGIAVPS